MKKLLTYLFSMEKEPKKGLMAFEWVVIAYLVATQAYIWLMNSMLPNASAITTERMKVLAITLALWGVYRLLPCGLTHLARGTAQVVLLGWWYPDIFELNRIFPNLDHIFASWEQALFGCQPALLFPDAITYPMFSEMMYMGYYSYYVIIAAVLIAIILTKHEDFDRVVTIVLATFFIHYVIFIVLPVTGPQYYYEAVGLDNIANGGFPNLHDYFNHNQTRMTAPGYDNGFFYALIDGVHKSERPVAAFPSSHVSVCVMLMLVAWAYRLKKLFWVLLPFAVLLCVSTVYIRAHYVIDALAGLISGTLCFFLLAWLTNKNKPGNRKA